MIILPMLLTLVAGGILSLIIIGIADVDLRQANYDRIMFEHMGTAQESIDAGKYMLIADDVSIYRSDSQKYVVVIPDGTDAPVNVNGFGHYFIPIVLWCSC